MKKAIRFGCVWLLLGTSLGRSEGFDHFTTREGDKLMDGAREHRFISVNTPNLHYIEDNLPFARMNPWHLPDEFEITDPLTVVSQMGGPDTLAK